MSEWLWILLPLHAAAAWFMTGLIWFVQIVHYPLMADLEPSRCAVYARRHQAQTTWVVAPVMLLEAALTVLIVIALHASLLAWVGVVLLAIIWISTFTRLVPLHQRLLDGYDGAVCRSLIRRNWVRTIAWTGRAVLALTMLI